MTVGQVLDGALALLFETRATAADYVQAAPALLNALLPETLGVNNQLRKLAGKEPLEAAPAVAALEDETGYEDALCRSVLPWGLAGYLLLGDEEQGRSVNYMAMYQAALENATRLAPETVKDVYE